MPQEQSYKKLLSLTEELEIKQKNFIIETVRSHAGIIPFKPKLEDGEDNDTDQDLYPITAIFYDGHESYPNVSITAIHILDRPEIEDVDIYVDGINQDTCEKQENFSVCPVDYANVVSFIGKVLDLDN